MLLYGMIEADADPGIDRLPLGVREARVEWLEERGLRCFYSRVEALAVDPESLHADALRFHAVLREILDHATIAPFRFPTLLDSDRAAREFLSSHAPGYLQDLQRLRGKVQMEVRVRRQGISSEPQSGKEYMDARLAETRALTGHSGALFEAARELIADWRAHQESHGLRCYALVRHGEITAFEERIRALSPPLGGVSVIVSGPWPPSEFLHVRNS